VIEMKVIVILMLVLVLLGAVACMEQTSVKSDEQAVDETLDIGNDVEDVGALLDEIDSDFG